MNILFLTSSMIDSDFSNYQDKAKIKPNPSNQNFYSKLIRSLAINNNVSVVSLRPFKKGMFKTKSFKFEQKNFGKIKYFYPRVDGSKFFKLFSEEKEIIGAAEKAISEFVPSDFIILTDTLRINLLRSALKIASNHKTKIVGVLTDNPDNLSNMKRTYATRLIKYTSKCDAFISLTKKLVENINGLITSYVFEGLVEEVGATKRNPINNYFFFAGSLYEKYGVKTLINSFHASNCESKLIIAGSGPLSKYIDKMASSDSRILYIGQISKEKVNAYELNSIANINPRPVNEKLDKESVPSKLLEYLSTGVPTISTKYQTLYNIFKDNVTWFDKFDVYSISHKLEEFEKDNYQQKLKMAKLAKQKVFVLYGIKQQSELITHYLSTLK